MNTHVKMKVSELDGIPLKYAVSLAWVRDNIANPPTIDGTIGHTLADRELISVAFDGFPQGWVAKDHYGHHTQYGKTSLDARLRCYVAIKLGEVVEIPQNLLDPVH